MLKGLALVLCLLASQTLCAAPDINNAESEEQLSTNPTDINLNNTGIDELNWYSGFNLTVGASYKKVTFEVSERGSNIKQGALTDDGQLTPSLILDTPFYYFTDPGKSAFGWFVEGGYSSFEVNKQAVGKYSEEVDMGTSVSGKYFYLVPVIFYNWGDAYIEDGNGVSFKVGLGPGIGYLQARGNIVLTETTNETETVNFSEFGGAIVTLLDFRAGNFLMRYRIGGPSPSTGNRVYTVYEESFEIGYSFTF